MRLSRQFQAWLFFLQKDFKCKNKNSQANINQQNKIKHTLDNSGNNFLHAQTSKRVKVTCFAIWSFSCVQNLFVKKKNKQAWNCLVNLIILYYWHVPLSTYLSNLYLHAFVFICNHLWESFLFMRIFLNLFLFMIICVNLFFKSLWK